MSTRRARIKAVAALPPRRKNADNAEKSNSNKDALEKVIKSPRTPKPLATKSHEEKEKSSPSTKATPSPKQIPHGSAPKTPITVDKVASSPIIVPHVGTPQKSERAQLSEKASVITSTSSLKSSIFASPLSKKHSPARPASSPVVISPKVKSNQNVPNVPQMDTSECKQVTGKLLENVNKHVMDISVIVEKNSGPDAEYSIPSVPESVTDEAVMDGIIPLQPARSAPKPIDLLKNEIISENAEVLFDPIVPLPSPSKVRPKLRPVPRLQPIRRNSIQGSASESEDESRRALHNASGPTTPAPPRQRHDSHTSHSTIISLPNRDVSRVRNDSVCSSVSQVTVQQPPATSPVKEKHVSKSRRQDASRRMAAMRRRRETVKRDTLTMYDLIFYNPTTNPIVPDEDEINATEANKKEEASRKEVETEEAKVDDPPPPTDEATPVPQIKLGPNGEIILDEKSLVINQTESNRKVSSVVREGAWGGSGGRYSRTARTADWSAVETVRFYRALAAIGTDFSLMAPLFPDRSRKDLKLKFKKEERCNVAQVDKALRSATAWDVAKLQEEFQEERAEEHRQEKRAREKLLRDKEAERERMRAAREMRSKQSRGAKALNLELTVGRNVVRNENEITTADQVIQRALEARELRKRRDPHQVLPGNLVPSTPVAQAGPYATLTLINQNQTQIKTPVHDMATISRIEPKLKPQENLNVPAVPPNIEPGSLVVLTVNDPSSPAKKMLQTYIVHGPGRMTPVALPANFLNSVVGYMKKGTPKSTMSTASSPQLTSPSSVASQDSRTCVTPGVIQINPSPAKRQRHSSYTITPL